MGVQVTEKYYLVVERVSHPSLISAGQWKVPEDLNGVSHAMYARKVSLLALIWTIIPEYTLE
jgi:hypothetical protein